MRVLYLHPAASFGGASKSLIELLKALHDAGTDIEAIVLTPAGTASDAFSDAGMQVHLVRGLTQFDNTRYGYYRGVRWLIILRELFFVPFSLLAIWQLRKERFDILHLNEITLLPLGIFAKILLKIPMVVHVRSLQRKEGGRTRLIGWLLNRYADAVVAIDHSVASTLPHNPDVEIVHNGLRVPEGKLKNLRHFGDGQIRIGFIGALIRLKGVYELIEAVRILKSRGREFECWIAGQNVRDISGIRAWGLKKLGFAADTQADLSDMIAKYGLQKQVKLIGFVSDIGSFYSQIDILCFPSHLDAAGRPVFEAAFYGVPSVVAVKDPLPDTVLHGVTGLAIERPDPELIADALERLIEDNLLRIHMGEKAKRWAEETFSVISNADRMADIYKYVLNRTQKQQPINFENMSQ